MENLTDLIVPAHFMEVCHTHGIATFESIYRASNCASWSLAAVFAIGAGAFVIFTGGLGSGPAAAFATWLGGLMGYSGAAATSAGLAFLGGGSIAAGGFGMVGGAAILTAALTFSTELVFDYTFNRAVSGYDYRSLADSSRDLPTLPLPINETGPEAYQSGLAVLEDIDRNWLQDILNALGCKTSIAACPESPPPTEIEDSRQRKILQAMEAINETGHPARQDDRARVQTLLSLLHFVSNDYQQAKLHAFLARFEHIEAGLEETDRTLPAFIIATATLYDEDVSHSDSLDWLEQSILHEPNNPLIPLMFSIYLDRLIHISDRRSWNDRVLHNSLREVFVLMQHLHKLDASRDVQIANHMTLLARYFLRLNLEQQKIMALVLDPDIAARTDRRVYAELDDALTAYTTLLNDSKPVIETALKTAAPPADETWLKTSRRALPWTGDREEMDREQIQIFSQLHDGYRSDLPRLACLRVYGKSRASHHFSNMDLGRTEILALATSINPLIKSHPGTGHRVRELLRNYDHHLKESRLALAGLLPSVMDVCDRFPKTQFHGDYLEFAKVQPRLQALADCLTTQQEPVDEESPVDYAVKRDWDPQSCHNLMEWR